MLSVRSRNDLTMRTRPLGQSGILVGEVGLGTWSLSGESYGPVTPDDARRAIEVAIEEGCTFLETSDCYAEGRTETLVGDVLRARGRDKAIISTRIGVDRGTELTRKNFTPKYLRHACVASLKRLGTEYIDALVLHNPQVGTITKGEAIECLKALKAEGKVRLVGVSIGSIEAGEESIAAGVDLVVVPYNVFYPKVLHRLSAALSTASVAVVVRSPLAYGLLADTWGASRRFREEDHRVYRWSTSELSRRVRQREALRDLTGGNARSIRELALRYVLANGLVSVVVPGARNPEHVRQNAHAADTLPYLADTELMSIGQKLTSAGVEA
jgi:aryl-alcohol dehydrogenase-like predicted oxidoreductase